MIDKGGFFFFFLCGVRSHPTRAGSSLEGKSLSSTAGTTFTVFQTAVLLG